MCGKTGKGIPARSPSRVNSVPKDFADIGPPPSEANTVLRPRTAHYHIAEKIAALCTTALAANVSDGSRAAVRATLALSPLCPPKRKSEASFVTSELCH